MSGRWMMTRWSQIEDLRPTCCLLRTSNTGAWCGAAGGGRVAASTAALQGGAALTARAALAAASAAAGAAPPWIGPQARQLALPWALPLPTLIAPALLLARPQRWAPAARPAESAAELRGWRPSDMVHAFRCPGLAAACP